MQAAGAAEAGKVIFVAGQAKVVDRAATEGAMVQEGELLSTGGDGFIYIKTIDNGLFILRPNTKARIVTYHVDATNPANTRIKLELISGVARSRSGEAVKLARQNFRFNTPVAAIGVRGTDFTVFTDNDTSRVAVLSGGIIMSGFADTCSPDGSGPCEGKASRELSATQRGQSLQVQRGQSAPQLVQAGPLSPDQVSPPRSDEPTAKNGGATEPNLDVRKNASLPELVNQPGLNNGSNNPPPPPTVTPPPVVETGPSVPQRDVLWGRWQEVAGKAPNFTFDGPAGAERVLTVGNYILFRTPGQDYVAPEKGSIGFALKNSEAYVFNDDKNIAAQLAQIQNGKLNVDFGSATFATSFDLNAAGEIFNLRNSGTVGKDGRLYGGGQFTVPNNMAVDGVLSNANGGTAAYLFQSRLDATRSANGATYWGK